MGHNGSGGDEGARCSDSRDRGGVLMGRCCWVHCSGVAILMRVLSVRINDMVC